MKHSRSAIFAVIGIISSGIRVIWSKHSDRRGRAVSSHFQRVAAVHHGPRVTLWSGVSRDTRDRACNARTLETRDTRERLSGIGEAVPWERRELGRDCRETDRGRPALNAAPRRFGVLRLRDWRASREGMSKWWNETLFLAKLVSKVDSWRPDRLTGRGFEADSESEGRSGSGVNQCP